MSVRTIVSLEDTTNLALELSKKLKGGIEVGFEGPLGSGKTTLISKILSALGSKDPVSSPTFVLCHEYSTLLNLKVEHWDLYRLKSLPPELEELPDTSTLRLIEWPSRNEELITRLTILIELEFAGNGERSAKIKTRG